METQVQVKRPLELQLFSGVARKSRAAGIVYPSLFLCAILTTPLPQVAPVLCGIIGVLLLAGAGFRFYLANRLISATAENLEPRKNAYSANILFMSLLWGGFCAWTFHRFGVDRTTMVVFISTAGIAGGSLVGLLPAFQLLRYHLLCVLGPGVAALLMMHNADSVAFGLPAVLYLSYLIIQSRSLSQTLLREIEFNAINSAQKRQLEVARERALSSARAKADFSAMMSHEMRTPLNGILGMTELLLETKLEDKSRTLASTIRDCGKMLFEVVNDVLEFSKIESGKLSPKLMAFDPRESLTAVVKVIEIEAAKKSLSVDWKVDASVPEKVIGDEGRLRQVLVNLLANAVKFTERGSVRVELRNQGDDDGRVRLVYSVADTGIGIAEEAMPKLFQSYSQVDSGSARRYGGAGLGLAISKRLVEWMGGEIHVTSTVGKGSVFHFFIPMNESELRETAPLPERILRVVPTGQTPARILVVEDNSVNQAVVLAYLAKAGYETMVAENGLEAIDAMEKNKFDLILMDCQMPEMDGYDATRRIRTRPYGKHIPIIALTAHALEGEREKCLKAGMNDYLTKPVIYQQLVRMLESHLQASNAKHRSAA